MIQLNRFYGGARHIITMSYDDGMLADLRLVELFDRYGIRGTFHLNSALLGDGSHVTPDQVQTAYVHHEVSAHSAHHPRLEQLPRQELLRELMEDRKQLEACCGYPVRGMSYPYGTYDAAVIEAAKVCGMEYSRTVQSTGSFGFPEDFLTWHPTCHHNGCTQELIAQFLERKEPAHTNLLFYIWGHSFEFDRQGNWEQMEEICKRLSGLNHVWYATNIEIADYINGLKQLKFSADGHIVYNPSAQPLWFSYGEESVKIEGGQTLVLTP